MNIATVYAWFARESVRAAEKTDDVRQRQMWMKLAEQWAAAARQSREKALHDRAAKRLQRHRRREQHSLPADTVERGAR